MYVPFVNPIPEAAIEDRLNAGPPKLDILPSSLIPPFAWIILSPNVNPLFVVAIDTNWVWENDSTGFSFIILPKGKSVLVIKIVPDSLVTNFALFNLNFMSSNWLGVQVLAFCDLNNEPKVGCLSFNFLVIKSTSPILVVKAL